MWIVRLALRRPYTFVVAALLLLLLTPFVLMRTPTDIFPAINIPVVSVVWNYTGLTARDIEQRMVFTEERALTTTVNNIQHIESTSYDGVGVVKIFFQPGVSPDGAVAQVTAESQTILKQLPPGTTPPLIIEYNASSVPILQYGTTSEAISAVSRTLLVEFEVDNSKHKFLPYSFGEVMLKDNDSDRPLSLPSNTLLFRAQGLQVAVVGPDGAVQLRSVEVGRDFGQTVEIRGGVTPADKVIINPTDSLVNGIKVRVQPPSSAVAAK